MIHFTCPQCDSEGVAPARKKAKRIGSLLARIHLCSNCKHKFIVVLFIARGQTAERLEERFEDDHTETVN